MPPDPTHRDETRLRELDAATLAERVQRALDTGPVTVDDWRHERIASGSRQHAGTAHYRVTVTGSRDRGGPPVECSFVVKIHRKEPDGAALIPADARREVGLYRSAVASECPTAFVPVDCHDVVEYPDAWWFWLADLGDRFASEWPLDRYERVAGHLGQFSGQFQGALPTGDWVGPYDFDFDRVAPVLALLDERPTDPAVEAVFPGPVRERVLACWQAREALLARHESLPRTLCHFDGFPGNLAVAADRTVAIDWELCGRGPLGADAAALTYVSAIWQAVDRDAIPAVGDRVLAAYLDGLRERGWDGDPAAVRAGYTLHLVLRWLESLGHVRRTLLDGQDRPGIDADAFVDWMTHLNRWVTDHVDDALALVDHD